MGEGPNRIVCISDFCDDPHPGAPSAEIGRGWSAASPLIADDRRPPRVTGGYLERLPLAAVAAGLLWLCTHWACVIRSGDHGRWCWCCWCWRWAISVCSVCGACAGTGLVCVGSASMPIP